STRPPRARRTTSAARSRTGVSGTSRCEGTATELIDKSALGSRLWTTGEVRRMTRHATLVLVAWPLPPSVIVKRPSVTVTGTSLATGNAPAGEGRSATTGLPSSATRCTPAAYGSPHVTVTA